MSIFDADAKSLSFLRQEGILEIPYFQRRYVWGKKNWEELYENLFNNEIPGFLGSIILKSKMRRYGEKPSSLVIDGQQRLTTLSIFVMALYDCMNEVDRIAYSHDLQSTLFNSQGLDLNKNMIFKPKIIHSQLDKKSFEKIMDLNNLNKLDLKLNEDDKIVECYKYFYLRFKNENYDKVKEIFNALVNGSTEIIVVIGINESIDEQKVFDTLNSAGVKLTMADTIKNYLFSKVDKLLNLKFNSISSQNEIDEKLVKIYNDTWKNKFLNNDAMDKIWNKEMVTGRIKRTNLDMFMHCYAIIKKFYEPSQTLNELPIVYKKQIDNIDNINEMEEFLNDMCYYAELYYDNFVNISNDYQYSYSKEDVLPRLLLFTNLTNLNTLNPYVLFLISNYKNNKKKLNEELHKVEKLLIYNHLNKNEKKTKNYNKLVVDFINNENRINEEINSFGNLEDGIIGLKDMFNTEAKFFLFMIELYRRKDDKNDISKLTYEDSYQLEHIIPIKWKKNWELPLYDDKKKKFKNDEDAIQYREERIKYLGNMTILKSKLNQSISHSKIERKINGYKGLKGMREYADFRITNLDVIKYYDKNRKWDEIRIKKRTESLYKEIKEALLY